MDGGGAIESGEDLRQLGMILTNVASIGSFRTNSRELPSPA
jgi:hypothetical protein